MGRIRTAGVAAGTDTGAGILECTYFRTQKVVSCPVCNESPHLDFKNVVPSRVLADLKMLESEETLENSKSEMLE